MTIYEMDDPEALGRLADILEPMNSWEYEDNDEDDRSERHMERM